MRRITKKSELKILVEESVRRYKSNSVTSCAAYVRDEILSCKVRFPLLEFCAHIFSSEILEEDHLVFCDQIEGYKTEGGNVILGIMLQNRLPDYFFQSIEKTAQYISQADDWYVCDIIGERVFGVGLLTQTERMLKELKKLSRHQSFWVVRSTGAGAHYAIKKGLGKKDVKKVFTILLTNANALNRQIRQGVGWAAKTTAKFHPDIIQAFENEINDSEKVDNWFRRKIKIGLERFEHAQRN